MYYRNILDHRDLLAMQEYWRPLANFVDSVGDFWHPNISDSEFLQFGENFRPAEFFEWSIGPV